MYTINRTDPSNIPVTVDMSTTKTQAGLTWVGQFHSRYGEILHENTLRLLENFASHNPPNSNDDPSASFNVANGMLWYDLSESHTNTPILKIQNGVSTVNNGWKRLEVIISNTLPAQHTRGEVVYSPNTKSLSISRGTNWDDITVKLATNSALLNGLRSDQFLRRDIEDSLIARVNTSELLPRTNMSFNIGSTTHKYNSAFIGTLIADNTHNLIPRVHDQYSIGSNSVRYKEINSVLNNALSYSDVHPLGSNNNIGTAVRKWNNLYTSTLYTDTSSTLLPINTSATLGTPSNRWNLAAIGTLDANRTRSLIPDGNNLQRIGDTNARFSSIDVNVIHNTQTQNLSPTTNNTFDLGTAGSRYRNIFVNNIVGSPKFDGTINFDIVRNSKSGGLRWSGLTDFHEIYVEETTNSETTNLVLHTGDNAADKLMIRQTNGGVTQNTIEVGITGVITRTSLKVVGAIEIESNQARGCRQFYNNTTRTLEFRFY